MPKCFLCNVFFYFILIFFFVLTQLLVIFRRLGSRVVSVLDSGTGGPGLKSQLRRCQETVLGKLFTPIMTVFTKTKIGSSLLKGCEGN